MAAESPVPGSDASALDPTALAFDLAAEVEALQRQPGWHAGPVSRILVKNDSLRVVLMAMKAGTRLPEHQAERRVSIQTIRGHLVVRAAGGAVDLPTGRLVALDRRVRHDVEALEDSAFVLTMA